MKRGWLNDGLVTGPLALSPHDRGLCLGDGLFETMLVQNGVVLWRFEHLRRFAAAAAELGIGFDDERIENALDGLSHRAKGLHVLRLSLTRGEGGRGLAGGVSKPTLIGTLQPFDDALQFQPVTLATVAIRRNLSSPASRLKSLSYIDNVLAARAAAARGADEALMLNSAGRVACCSIGNVFLEAKGELITPSLAEGILPGIMRQAVIDCAGRLGITVREKQVRVPDLVRADAVFMTNSLRFVRAVTTCDGKRYARRSKLMDGIIRGLLQSVQEQLILN